MSLTSAQLATLKTFLTTDPHSLGFASKITSGDAGGIADLMNTVNSAGWAQVNNEPVQSTDIITLVTPDDLTAMSLTQKQSLMLLIEPPTVDLSNANMLANLRSCFPPDGGTIPAITLLSKRAGRPGEVLFGNGTIITATDVSNTGAIV